MILIMRDGHARAQGDAPRDCSKRAEYVCADTYTARGRCQWDRPRRPENLLTIINARRPGRAGGGASGAGRWADGQTTNRQGELNGDKLQARHAPERGDWSGLGAWHCHNLSDRRDLEHLGRRGGRRVETRRHGWAWVNDWFARFPVAEV